VQTLIIGLGNPILTDDGAGILAARLVAERLPPTSGVDVVELAVGGLALMEAMIGYERVILLDALYAPAGTPGKVVQFSAGELPETLNSASAHDVNLPTALRLGRELGAALPETAAIQVVGVYAQEVLTFGDSPTPPVAAAIPEMAARVLRLLEAKNDDFS
jgi:hydrogenase maturation protease